MPTWDPIGHLARVVGNRVYIALKTIKKGLKGLLNGWTTQIHNPCGHVRIYQKVVDIFLTDLDPFSFLVDLETNIKKHGKLHFKDP